MPYKDPEKQRRAVREAKRRKRAAERAGKTATAAGSDLFAAPRPDAWPAEPGKVVCDWAAVTLRIPAGHPNAGEPLILPDYLAAFIGDALAYPESCLCIARKNAKSAAVAVLVLAHLAGPLRTPGWRCGIASVNAQKAAEMYRQIIGITEASGIEIEARRAPVRRVYTAFGEAEVLPATDDAGQASSFDLAIVDEIGMLTERHREFVAGMRSSVSAKAGRFVSLSIHGPGPFIPEILARKGAADLAVHLYQAPADAMLDDEAAWRDANPGLETIKDIGYMRTAAARAAATPADQAHFRAHDLNLPGAPGAMRLVDADHWARANAAAKARPAESSGRLVLGMDIGDGVSMSAFAGYHMATGRLDCFAAFPAVPDLRTRGDADGVGALYDELAERGELLVSGDHAVDLAELVAEAIERWGRPAAIVADRFKRGPVMQALRDAGISAPVIWRGMGFKDGAEDVSDFRRAVADGHVCPVPSLLLAAALDGARTISDPAGNAKLAKGSEGERRKRHRDDAAAAAVLAVAVGWRERRKAGPSGGRRRFRVAVA